MITFEPHPLRFFTGRKTPPFITLYAQRAELIAHLGVDYLLSLEFNQDLAQMPPEEFVRRVLLDHLRVRELIIGHDYAFGKGRQGNYELLRTLGADWGFAVEQMAAVMVDEVLVSSTRIRDLVEVGDVWAVRPLRPFLSRFRHGDSRSNRGGRLPGFSYGQPSTH